MHIYEDLLQTFTKSLTAAENKFLTDQEDKGAVLKNPRHRCALKYGVLALTASLLAAGASATSTMVYKYDDLGRLQRSCSSQPLQGQRTDYSYDASDNRTAYVSARLDIFLQVNGTIVSADGRFKLIMQSDGNLVLYMNYGSFGPLWATGTYGTGADRVYFQSDGNLVVGSPTGVVWATHTEGNPCARLAVQNDGNVVIYSADGAPVWATNTSGH